jgi:hypothetical protein
MPSTSASDRKRKQMVEEPEVVSSSHEGQSKSKTRRVSTDAKETAVTSHETTREVTTANANANAASTTIATQEDESMESIGQMIQDLSHSTMPKSAPLSTP